MYKKDPKSLKTAQDTYTILDNLCQLLVFNAVSRNEFHKKASIQEIDEEPDAEYIPVNKEQLMPTQR